MAQPQKDEKTKEKVPQTSQHFGPSVKNQFPDKPREDEEQNHIKPEPTAEEVTQHRAAEFALFDPTRRQEVLDSALRAATTDQASLSTEQIEQQLSLETGDEMKRVAIARRFEERQTAFNAQSLGLPYINLYGFPINLKALSLISQKDAESAEMVCFYLDESEVRVGTPNPKNQYQASAIEALKKHNLVVSVYLISPSSFRGAIKNYEDIIHVQEHTEVGVEVTAEIMAELGDKIEEFAGFKERMERMPVTKTIDIIIAAALKLKASDIHVEPQEKEVRLRFRLDGVLQPIFDISLAVYQQILNRIKLLSRMKVNVRNIPQDGRFTVTLPERQVDIRVSTLPSGYGESIVMRLLGVGAQSLDLEKLGLDGHAREVVERQLKKPNGMILTTGPTGSGKTTTLYSFLNFLNEPGVKIITLEDPIEYRLPGIQQTPIDREAGLDFASGLRAILRQDPDIVLVGEIRDLETAEIATQAALTGHVVFSTLHTNDAAGVLPRLINMGLRQFVIAPAINCIIAQRLVRVLCPKCKEQYKPTAEELKYITTTLGEQNMPKYAPREITLYRAKRCEDCLTGYKGRIGVFEVFEMSSDIEKLIMRAATVGEIREAAIEQGMLLVAQDGVIKAMRGVTSIDEIQRVAGL